jgi:sugar-specific transcriptional regulator TrmB
MNPTILRMMQLGLSEYEAKAYMALLIENPLTAYEIAKSSGIPTSKIYEVIRKLEKRGIMQAIHGERSKMYTPLSPDEFVQEFRSVVEDNLQAIKGKLKDVKVGMDRSYTWHIKDYDGLIHTAKRMLDTARMTILMSTWPHEMKLLSESLNDAKDRGVKIAFIHYGATSVKIKQSYIHPVEDTLYSERAVRGLTLVADSREALNGTVAGEKTEAIWSMNEAYVLMAESYMRHDIYQMKIVKRFSLLLKRMFGLRYEKLRDVFNDDGN